MVTEHVFIKVKPENIGDFIAAMEEGQSILRSAYGVREIAFHRGVESDTLFMLLIEWNQIEDHNAFTKTADFGKFGGLVGQYFQEKPSIQHFTRL
jgi:heme-degrading monooxygenase HmoA